ncbi:hypothetical protein SSUST1_1308 [Streptococcus suis ST1]|nr:hypothetical protein SSUST1_1308 [Streptococcus suis ST1]VTT04863.1 Uncharacterised protein [Streptococcus suis]
MKAIGKFLLILVLIPLFIVISFVAFLVSPFLELLIKGD